MNQLCEECMIKIEIKKISKEEIKKNWPWLHCHHNHPCFKCLTPLTGAWVSYRFCPDCGRNLREEQNTASNQAETGQG